MKISLGKWSRSANHMRHICIHIYTYSTLDGNRQTKAYRTLRQLIVFILSCIRLVNAPRFVYRSINLRKHQSSQFVNSVAMSSRKVVQKWQQSLSIHTHPSIEETKEELLRRPTERTRVSE